MSQLNTYIQYGVQSDWAQDYIHKGISATEFKNTSKRNLTTKYQIPIEQIAIVKKCLVRNPIDDDVLQELLERNRFVCCLCRGQKSDAYIIHHIESYAISQNNDYDNLAVLCPNDHDLVHREGIHLTNKINKIQVIKAKIHWEKFVEKLDVEIASKNAEISEVDYINVPRILDLYKEIFHTPPSSKYIHHLYKMNALDEDGNMNFSFLEKVNRNPSTPFIFGASMGSSALSLHFEEVFKEILKRLNFIDLDDLINSKAFKSGDLTGKFCFYVGGLYGNQPDTPINNDTPCTHLYFHRRSFFIEWIVDPKYMKSNSSILRLSERTEYLIYGRIRSTGSKVWKNKEYKHISIRPYLFGLPIKKKSRKPEIHYFHKYRDFDFEEEF